MAANLKRALEMLAGLLIMLVLIVIAVSGFARMTRKDLLVILGLVAVIAILVALGRLFPSLRRAIPFFFGGIIWLAIWMLITTVPILLFTKLSEFILFETALRFQVITLLAWAVLIIFALRLIATQNSRNRLFSSLKDAGSFAPVIYSFNVLMAAIIFFASVTYVLVEHDLVKFKSDVGGRILHSNLLEFYTWHFLDAIPLLKVIETLQLGEATLTYVSGPVGLLLLLFKITVIIPVIAAFAGYWKYEDNRANWDDHSFVAEAASEADLRVTFFGVSTLLFDDGETKFMIDGFFTRPGKLHTLTRRIAPDPKRIKSCLQKAETGKLKAVIVGHSHYDHALDASEVVKQTGAILIGSKSTARIGLGCGLTDDDIDIISDQDVRTLGRFKITFLASQHSPITLLKVFDIHRVVLAGEVKEPFKSPAYWFHYKEGGTYSILIEHDGKSMLVQGSAGYIPGALRGRRAEVVFLGIGTLGKQRDQFMREYWREVVQTVRARRVIPIHWDDFSKPADDDSLVPQSRLVDNVERSMAFLLARGEQTKIDVKILPAWLKVDPFEGL